MNPIKIQIKNFFKKFNFSYPKGKGAAMRRLIGLIILFSIFLLIIKGAATPLGQVFEFDFRTDFVLILFLVLFIILYITVFDFTKPLDKRKNQLRTLIRWSYFYTFFFLWTGFFPFILLDKFPDLKHLLATSPIGVVRGCAEILPGQSNASVSSGMLCNDQPTSNPGQWLINIGGGVVGSFPDQEIAEKDVTGLLAEAEKLDPSNSLQAKLKEINTAWLRYSNKVAVETNLLSELRNDINDILITSFETRKKLKQDLESLKTSGKENEGEEKVNEALQIIQEIDSKLKKILTSIQMPRTWKIHGGLVVPLYFVVLAIMGAIVSMTRKVPKIQQDATDSGTQNSMEKAREDLIFQILQVISSPLIAFTAFYLVNPANPAGIVTLGFVSGFASETILQMIRAGSDKIGAGLKEEPNEKAKSEAEAKAEAKAKAEAEAKAKAEAEAKAKGEAKAKAKVKAKSKVV